MSGIILGAVLLWLGLAAWNAWQEDRREREAWRRVGSCAAIGTSDTVTCTGVNLVWIVIPRGIAACDDGGTCRARVNRESAPAFQWALDQVVARDLGGAVPQFQTVNRRRCRDARTGTFIPGCISKHSFGIAVDFRPVDETDIWDSVTDGDSRVMEVVAVFREAGFRWGGTFASNFDPQHLEWRPGSRLPASPIR